MKAIEVASRDRAPFWAHALPALLSAAEAARRLARDGPNTIDVASRHRGFRLLVAQLTSPIIVILAVATMLAAVLGDLTDGSIILAIIVASGLLGFWRGHRAGLAVDALDRMPA